MKKLLFVNHDYDKKKKSNDFLKKILKKKFLIKDCWVDKNLNLDRKIYQYENIFFHQILPPLKILRKLKNKNITWTPMYDSPMYPTGYSWLLWMMVKFYNVKIITFSKAITNQIFKKKIRYFDLKYFEKSKKINHKKKGKIKILFWDRNEIKLKNWIDKFNLDHIEKIYYLKIENNELIQLKDKKIQKKVFYIDKKFSKNNNYFRNLIKNTDVFICPREKEGIGMAMIEALSYGKYLIAKNDNTMTEYIYNKKIGSFLNDNLSRNHILKNIKKYSNYRIRYNTDGYNKYLQKEKKIISFVSQKQNYLNKNLMFEFIIIFMYYFKIAFRKVHLILKKI